MRKRSETETSGWSYAKKVCMVAYANVSINVRLVISKSMPTAVISNSRYRYADVTTYSHLLFAMSMSMSVQRELVLLYCNTFVFSMLVILVLKVKILETQFFLTLRSHSSKSLPSTAKPLVYFSSA